MAWDHKKLLLTCKEVMILTGLSRTTVWRWEGDGRFPPALRLPGGGPRWLVTAVLRWIDALPSGSRAEARARWKWLVERGRRGRPSARHGTDAEDRP